LLLVEAVVLVVTAAVEVVVELFLIEHSQLPLALRILYQ
jgi:hypothetical protein